MDKITRELFESRSDLFDHYADLINTLHGLIEIGLAMKMLQVDTYTLKEVCEQHMKYLRANTEHFRTLVELKEKANGTH